LQSLVEALLAVGGMLPGHERAEIKELWAAALRDAPRLRTPLDTAWLDRLPVTREPAAAVATATAIPMPVPSAPRPATLTGTPRAQQQDWGEAPDVSGFIGRPREREELRRWLVEDRCRMVVLLGLGGMGKTMMASRAAADVADDFELVFWRSLRNAPSVNEWLGAAVGFLSNHELLPPEDESGRREMLLRLLRERRCLLVLDNLETVLAPSDRTPEAQTDFLGFRSLIQVLAETSH